MQMHFEADNMDEMEPGAMPSGRTFCNDGTGEARAPQRRGRGTQRMSASGAENRIRGALEFTSLT